MGSEENNRTVRGNHGTLQTSTTGVIQTDNYADGAALKVGPGLTNTYPHTFDPTGFTIQFLKILETGTDIRMDVTTKDGTVIPDIALRGAGFEEEAIEMDSVTLRDPNSTGDATYGYYSGE
ncbi:hypothetical protein [Halorussus halophilus]|uniref:hypothetical protein n=1 Tax=Halorussus halophilus TaxID=2650975 RepID=UPI0013012A4A|nr:hypothetical protein [Halorussus halophilus]